MTASDKTIDCQIQVSLDGLTWVDLHLDYSFPWPFKRAIVAPEAITKLQNSLDKMLGALQQVVEWDESDDPDSIEFMPAVRQAIAGVTNNPDECDRMEQESEME
jgi:hypothetical protein